MIPLSPAHVIHDLLQIQSRESTLIIYDSTTHDLCQMLANLSGGFLYNLDKHQRPLTKIPKSLSVLCSSSDIVFYAISKRGDASTTELNFRRELHELVESEGGRVGNLLGVSQELATQVFVGDPQEIRRHTQEVLELARSLHRVEVTNDLGTKLVVTFDPAYKWLASTGFIQKGVTRNTLPAEVYTYPSAVEGLVVSKGTYGLLGYLPGFEDSDKTISRIEKNPITWKIEDSRIVEVLCDDKEILEGAKKAIFESECSSRIGEFGLGTNPFIQSCTGVMFVDEKMQGLHIAHGHGYPKSTGAPYQCNTHYDLIVTNPTIIDLSTDSVIFENGGFYLEKE